MTDAGIVTLYVRNAIEALAAGKLQRVEFTWEAGEAPKLMIQPVAPNTFIPITVTLTTAEDDNP